MLTRRDFVAVAAATAATPQLASAQPAAPTQKSPSRGSTKNAMSASAIRKSGSGFPLLVTPGGGLNSRISNWATAVFNAPEAFKNDFRVITMDQRNANGGEFDRPDPG